MPVVASARYRDPDKRIRDHFENGWVPLAVTLVRALRLLPRILMTFLALPKVGC